MNKRVFLFLFFFSGSFFLNAQDIKNFIDKIIVRIDAKGANNHVSTGFFWFTDSTILTTYHGLKPDEGKRISRMKVNQKIFQQVTIFIGNKNYHGYVISDPELTKRDLAFIVIQNYKSPKFIQPKNIDTSFVFEKQYQAFGYAGNNTIVWKNNPLKAGVGITKYSQLLNPDELYEVKIKAHIDVSLPIHYFNGTPIHGHSGAPVFNTSNGHDKLTLVGIHEGGNAREQYTYAIPSSFLLKKDFHLLLKKASRMPARGWYFNSLNKELSEFAKEKNVDLTGKSLGNINTRIGIFTVTSPASFRLVKTNKGSYFYGSNHFDLNYKAYKSPPPTEAIFELVGGQPKDWKPCEDSIIGIQNNNVSQSMKMVTLFNKRNNNYVIGTVCTDSGYCLYSILKIHNLNTIKSLKSTDLDLFYLTLLSLFTEKEKR